MSVRNGPAMAGDVLDNRQDTAIQQAVTKRKTEGGYGAAIL